MLYWKDVGGTDRRILTLGGDDNVYFYIPDSANIIIRDDAGSANRITINAAGDMDIAGFVDAATGFKDNGTAGVDGTFVDNNGKTVTVSGGIITNLDT